jgi:hypothetical protein
MAGMHLDHVSYAVAPDQLADALLRLGSAAQTAFTDGGLHPRFGTRSFVAPLAGGSYLEVVTTLDHPAADAAPFGQAVRRRADQGGGWLGWVVAVDDIAAVEQRLGRTAAVGHRRRPDGVELRWNQIGVSELIERPHLPFFIQWLGANEHPSTGARGDVRIARLEIAGDADTVTAWLGGTVQEGDRVLDGIDIDCVAVDPPGLLAVDLNTPNGTVRVE